MGDSEYVPEDPNAFMSANDLINQNIAQLRLAANYKNWQTPAAAYEYTPEQLGYSAAEAQRFLAAGITKLPAYMQKSRLYGPEVSLGGDDPIQVFIDANQKPTYEMGGKVSQALAAMGNPDLSTWDDEAQRAYAQAYTDRKWKTNSGTFKESILPAIQGIGSILAPIAGLGTAGAFAAPVAAAEAGAAGAGGLSAAEASALAGESAAGYGAAGAGGNALTGSLGGIGGGVYGFSNTTPAIGEAITSGVGAGADVGMGAGTSWLTDLGLPASYGSGLSGLGSYATSGGGGMGVLDSLSSLLGGGSGGSGISTNALLQLINAGIGAGGTYLGGQAQANASDKASDTLWNMYQQSRADTASQRALLDQSLPFLQDRTYNAASYMPTIPTLQNEVSVDYANDPIYQAQMEEMLRTLNRRYASQGRNMSSSADDAITRGVLPFMQDAYSRNLDTLNRTNQNALTTYGLGYQQQGDIYGRGLDLTKIGAGAAGQAGQNALSTGNALAGNQINAGNNQANMYGSLAGVGMGSINNYMLYNLLNQRKAA